MKKRVVGNSLPHFLLSTSDDIVVSIHGETPVKV